MKKIVIVFRVLVALTFLLGLASTTAAVPRYQQTKLQPELLQVAQREPQRTVAVIIQKMVNGGSLETLVAHMGGKVTKNLHIINAFAAELPAKALLSLAQRSEVRWVSLDAPVKDSNAPVDTTFLQSVYLKAVGADRLWNEGPSYLQGQGVTVAVVDSGDCLNKTKPCNDLLGASNQSRVLASISVMTGAGDSSEIDFYGHGSLVEGVIGGAGLGSNGKYMGVAPGVNLVSVKVADNLGKAMASDVVNGLQWVLDNKIAYNIRIVNISLNSSMAQSYHTDPMDAAVEILWFNGIVVVTSAGNNGSATLYPPANDPFVITVGATDDMGTAFLDDDVVASFSAYGLTESGFSKPELVAPGKNLISIVPRTKNKIWKDHQSNYTGESATYEYFMRVSGTSFAAPVVSGAVALLLQNEPGLTPDQVKFRLMATANKSWPGYDSSKAGAGYLDVYTAVHGSTTQSANTGFMPSQLLSTGANPITFGSVGWNSVGWNSVGWNSVGWNSVGWNSVGWNSDYWGP